MPEMPDESSISTTPSWPSVPSWKSMPNVTAGERHAKKRKMHAARLWPRFSARSGSIQSSQ